MHCICKYTCGQSPGGHDGWVPGFFKRSPLYSVCKHLCINHTQLGGGGGWLLLDFGKINTCTVGFYRKEYLCSHVHSILLEGNTTNSTTRMSLPKAIRTPIRQYVTHIWESCGWPWECGRVLAGHLWGATSPGG